MTPLGTGVDKGILGKEDFQLQRVKFFATKKVRQNEEKGLQIPRIVGVKFHLLIKIWILEPIWVPKISKIE